MASFLCSLLAAAAAWAEGESAALPAGVRAVWDLEKAQRETTATRERVSINGLWRWQPGKGDEKIPDGAWGYFKVPASWPGITDYQHKDCQAVWPDAAWKDLKLGTISSAWSR